MSQPKRCGTNKFKPIKNFKPLGPVNFKPVKSFAPGTAVYIPTDNSAASVHWNSILNRPSCIITCDALEDFANARFVTNAQFDALEADVNALQADVDSLQEGVVAIEANVSEIETHIIDIDEQIANIELGAPVTKKASVTVGGINAGDEYTVGTISKNAESIIKLLTKIFTPTFVLPSFGLSNNKGTVEVGSTVSVTLSFSFNRGQITGQSSNDVWNPGAVQGPRAGAAIDYIIAGTSTGTTPSRALSRTVTLGANSFSATVSYAAGQQPVDSDGENFDSPYAAGTSPSQNTSFQGDYLRFFGAGVIAANSAQVRALSSTFGNSFSIVIQPGQTQASFAYPASKPDILDSSVKYQEGFNSNVGNTLTKSLFDVNDGGGNPTPYKIYTVTLPAPEAGTVTYNVNLPN